MKKVLGLFVVFVFFSSFFITRPNYVEIYNAGFSAKDVNLALKKASFGSGFLWMPSLFRGLDSIGLVERYKVDYIFDGLQIRIKPYDVVARLKNARLLTSEKSIITADMPVNMVFYDADYKDSRLMNSWLNKNKDLFDKSPYILKELGYDSDSNQFRVLWGNNLLVLLGHSKMARKNLQRFVDLLPYLRKHKFKLMAHVLDMRYQDGFAFSKM